MKRVMFISSVGGHLTQLLELKSIFKDYNYVLVTEKTEVTKDMKSKYNMNYLLYGSREYLLSYIFKFSFRIYAFCSKKRVNVVNINSFIFNNFVRNI